MELRTCTKCKAEKPVSAFYPYNRFHCMDCHRKIAKLSRAKANESGATKEYAKKRYQKYKAKYIARAKVGHAIKDGTLIKPEQCSECLNAGAIHAHHDDYSQPLVVDWLCDSCHKLRHGKLRDKTLIAPKGDSK